MISDLIIIIIFLYIGMIGFRRGIWLGALHLGSTIFSLWVAHRLHSQISQRLELFVPFPKTRAYDLNYAFQFDNLQQRFDHIIAFLIIATVTKVICYAIVVVFDNVITSRKPNWVSRMLGVIMSVISSTIICATLVYMISMYPLEFMQQQLMEGHLAEHFIFHVPFISTYVLNI
ncbi:CvpA family protein [Staphylococcus shinii]|uniref:CvpA family protein n=1 Tax=Staphylococcus shinii TaxID=2912228 RepID=UPI000D1FD0E8|nr:CvpA family protein [Staphylococcus shinii]PTI03484.1 colicin V production protein CvpA [Staphylococcus shinii]RIN03579.1 CvpA family protein [Staphylococcus shinii]